MGLFCLILRSRRFEDGRCCNINTNTFLNSRLGHQDEAGESGTTRDLRSKVESTGRGGQIGAPLIEDVDSQEEFEV